MHLEQPRPSKPDLIVELTELSRELRNAIDDVAVETIKVDKLSWGKAYAESGDEGIVAAANDRHKALERFHEIWDRARKPIMSLGMKSNYGDKLLAEFRCLSLRPDAIDVLKFVEFLEVFLETDAPAPIADLGDNVQAQKPQKRPRGRPSKIFEERKVEALEVRKRGGGNREAAKILYGTEEPKKTQRDSVSAILKAHCKKHGLSWPPK